MLQSFKNHLIQKPDKEYLDWLFPQNKQSLVYGLIFTFVTTFALSCVDFFYYSEAYYSSLPIPQANPFGVYDFYRLCIVPSLHILAIFLAASDRNKSMKTSERIAGGVLFFTLIGLLGTSTTEPYCTSDDFMYDALVLILFSKLLFGLTFRTSLFYNFIIVSCILVFMVFDFYIEANPVKIILYDFTLLTLIWIPLVVGTYKLEKSRVSNFRTISVLKDAHQELDKQKQLLRAGENVSQLASWNAAKDLTNFSYSEGIYAIYELRNTSLQPSELFDHILELVHPDDKNILLQIVHSLQEGTTTNFSEYRLLFPDGRIKWLKVTVGDYIEEEGYYGTIQDVTKEKKLELKLQNQANELKIKNEDLQQFAFASSHDLQEPLRSITNFVSILDKRLSHQLSEEHKLYMSIVLNSAERMKNLIHAILDYSRIGRNKALELIDCNEIVKNVITDLSLAIEESNGTVQVGSLPIITGYKAELSTLIQNLVSNALKFKRDGVAPIVKIIVKTANDNYHFQIQDNGIGIEKKYAHKIFQLFSRLHTKDKYEGTGIGLTHSKKIVELHGGRIWVESEINKGTTFHFVIPKHLKVSTNEKEVELHYAN